MRRFWYDDLNLDRDFSSGFIADRDYRSLTLLSRTGIDTALGATLLLLASGDKAFGANQFYGDFQLVGNDKIVVCGNQARFRCEHGV